MGELGGSKRHSSSSASSVSAVSTKIADDAFFFTFDLQALQLAMKHAKVPGSASTAQVPRNPAPATTRKLTAFQDRVLAACRAIPAGQVATYKSLAEAVDCGSTQAVGQALRRNPYPTYAFDPPYPAHMVPCHRVVSSTLAIGGFNGSTAVDSADIQTKVRLLAEEGVCVERVKDGLRVSKVTRVWKSAGSGSSAPKATE